MQTQYEAKGLIGRHRVVLTLTVFSKRKGDPARRAKFSVDWAGTPPDELTPEESKQFLNLRRSLLNGKEYVGLLS